jgi:hypothetical protein
MLACTRCGRWHVDAERELDRDLSCSEVKQYWSRIKSEHKELYGHSAKITTDDNGARICFECKRELPSNNCKNSG